MHRTNLIEGLETRTMFSVFTTSITNGNLQINGTAGRDDLTVDAENQVAHTKTINIGSDTYDYTFTTQDIILGSGKARKTFHDIQYVNIDMKGGDDKVTLHGDGLSDFWTMVTIDLGKGNDKAVIQNYDGAVQVNGGDGNDIIDATAAIPNDAFIGMSSARYLFGDAGNDTIKGSNTDDQLFGGNGNDVMYGNAGDDYFNGGTGSNKLFGGDGDDYFSVNPINGLFPDSPWSLGGYDQIDGGDGDDTVFMAWNSKFDTKPIFGTKPVSNVETTQMYDYASDDGGKG